MNTTYKGTNSLLIGIVLAVTTFWLFAGSVTNIVPDLSSDLGISMDVLNTAISFTTLFCGISIVAFGGIADKYGRKKITYLGLVFNIIGCLLCIFTPNSSLLMLGRIFQGFAGACIMPATMSLVKTYYDGAERQRAISFWSFASWGGGGLCAFVGGAIASSIGWRWIFVFSIAVSLISMMLIKGCPESKAKRESTSFDYLGLITLIFGLLALNLFITRGPSLGWTSPIIIGLALVSFFMFFVFYKIETSKEYGLVDFSLFKNKEFAAATFSNFLLNAVAGATLVINTYIQVDRGFTSFQSGMLSLGYCIATLSMIRVGEALLQKIGQRTPMILGSALNAVGILLMTMVFVEGTFYNVLVFIGYAIYGIGLGLYATPSTDTALSSAPLEKVGVASGIYKMASSLGGSFGIAISGAIYSALSTKSLDLATVAGLWVNILFGLISIMCIMMLLSKSKSIFKVYKVR